jgi:hypothetical protein
MEMSGKLNFPTAIIYCEELQVLDGTIDLTSHSGYGNNV